MAYRSVLVDDRVLFFISDTEAIELNSYDKVQKLFNASEGNRQQLIEELNTELRKAVEEELAIMETPENPLLTKTLAYAKIMQVVSHLFFKKKGTELMSRRELSLKKAMAFGRGLANKKEPVISFIAKDKKIYDVFDKPVPASKLIPEWYKKENTMLFSDSLGMSKDGNPSRTIKACMPIFDIITAGYMITLPADLNIEKNQDGTTNVQWSTDYMEMITHHSPEQFSNLSVPSEYYNLGYKFMNNWIIKTKPGYSCIFMQPSLRDDLPFQIIPAIVDTDKHPVTINFPFFLRKDFSGVIEMGTPIVQIIPFKREDWNSEFSFYENQEDLVEWQKAKRKIMNRYKTYYRTQKIWR